MTNLGVAEPEAAGRSAQFFHPLLTGRSIYVTDYPREQNLLEEETNASILFRVAGLNGIRVGLEAVGFAAGVDRTGVRERVMQDRERLELEKLVLAPYIQKATALIGRGRRVGGNQFRHAMATLAILIDYHFTDAVLLKASVIHDLIEEVPETDPAEIRAIDEDGEQVVELVLEVTRGEEPKRAYLERIRDCGSYRAKALKVADRISNLTDLHKIVFGDEYVRRYLEETVEFVYPVALEIDAQMAHEIGDLIDRRRRSLFGVRADAGPATDAVGV